MTTLPAAVLQYTGAEELSVPGSLAARLVERSHALAGSGMPLGVALAASFDLLVAARFYEQTKPENWLWCERSNLDIYPFLNACPACVLEHRFVHHDGNKPESGAIGPITAGVLRRVLVEHYRLTGKAVRVATGREPVDLAVIDYGARTAFLAEVKASPLFTPPLATPHTAEHFQATSVAPLSHSRGILRDMAERDIMLVTPGASGQKHLWPLRRTGLGRSGWSEVALADGIAAEPAALERYVRSWAHMWALYLARDRSDPAFWFTGACGLPASPGPAWPKAASGKPRGSVSDSKTSVGMDRTDDIKKSTFQVLNLGVAVRRQEKDGWQIKVGLASNLHAGRHYADYLAQYEDVAWGWLTAGAKTPAEWYNLFDGVVAFSESHTRDAWLRGVLDWH